MVKISIIGAGSVGSTIAYTLATQTLANEIVMIDINKQKADGEALDIQQGLPFSGPCAIYAGDYSDAKDSDIVIITSGIARKVGQTRLELAQINVDVTKSIIPDITRYAPNATYIIVSNPVDILTYTFHKFSGLPERQIIGAGTILDTARVRAKLSEFYNINQGNVHAYVFGEHGDSSFVPWSVANISNVPIVECDNVFAGSKNPNASLNFEEIEKYVKESGGKVIAHKGATFYAVSISVCHIVKCILSGIDTTMTVSTMMHGDYGIDDVCLSTLSLVGKEGFKHNITISLTDEEIAKLHKSANTLKDVIKAVKI